MTKFCKRVVLFSFVLFLSTLTLSAQTVLLSDGFETGLQTNNWTTANYTANSGNWVQYFYSQNTGTYSAAYFPNNQNANSWLFTKALPFTQGKYYQIKYYAKVDINTSFQTTLSTSTTFSAPKTTIRNSYVASYPFNLVIDTIVAESTNNFYIGFQNYSAAASSGTSSLIDDVEITELNLPTCSNVNAGTISSTITNICPNTPFILNSINATTNVQGIKYSWQKSSDNVNWVNITNGYTYQKNITLTQTQPTYYRHVDTCTTSGLTSISNSIQIANTSYLNCSCTPSPINCFGSQTFTNIKINNGAINNTSTCVANGYGNYTALPAATTYRNQNAVIQTTVSNPNNFSYYIGIWIDFDQNSIFDQNEFTINGPYTTAVNTTQITIPNTALLGQTRIRIQAKAYFSTNPLPYNYSEACTGTGQTGETEDYLLNIAIAPNCTGPVTAGTIAASVTQICPNNNFTISATGTTTNAAQMRYAWQQSTDNVNWTNLNNTGYLINPLTISQNNTSFYRLVDTCLASGTTSISNAINITGTNLFNCYCAPNNAVCSTIGIDTVRFNTINNGSPTCPTGGYNNFTAISTTINNGSYVPIYLKLKNNTTLKYADVYIDFNRNGTFSADEKAFNGVGTSVIAGNVYIPFDVVAGATLMRVIASNSSFSAPCISSFTTGETEDYTVIINLTSPTNSHFNYYVNKLATGLNNGTNWANAFTNLSSAFSQMRIADTVRVAQGTYTAGTANTSSLILKDSVVILGGYPNTGNPTNTQRNFSQYPTILSGEIGSSTLLTDNTKIILQSYNTKGSIVDGFIIEKGYDGYVSSFISIGPVSYNLSTGTLQNTVIRNNFNEGNGAGLNIQASTILLKNCVFEKDSSNGIYNNTSQSIININSKATLNIQNTVFAKCKSQYLFNVNNSTLNITNGTVFKNWGNSYIHDTSSVQIQNSIFYYNGNNYLKDTIEFEKDVYSTLNLQNSITEVYTHPSFNGQNPKFLDTLNVAGADNLYFTADDGLSLINPCSPAINIGNNTFVSNISTDITGSTRIANGLVDLGAYEVQAPIASQALVLYVNKTATGLNNGTSWANAFTDLQAAFYRCSDTIKVAMGSYPVSSTDETANFRLANNRVIIGGYPNTGNPTNAQYNPITNLTQLSGQVNANINSKIIVNSNGNDSTAKIIGFEIINSAAPLLGNAYISDYGALKIANNSAPYLESIQLNCSNNDAMKLALITNGSKPKLYKCSFYSDFNAANYDLQKPIWIDKNSSPIFLKCYTGKDTTNTSTFGYQGAAYMIANSSCKFDSCFFYKSIGNTIQNNGANTTIQNSYFKEVFGRSVSNNNASTTINNCTFYENPANVPSVPAASGYGVIQNLSNSLLNVNKCTFLNSYAAVNGGVCQNNNSTATFKNSIFKNPHADNSGGAFYNVKGALNILNCVSYYADLSNSANYGNAQFALASDSSRTTIINSTILSNSYNSVGVLTNGTNCTLKFYNSIIWRYGEGQIMQFADQDITTTNNNSTAICDIRNSILYKQTNTLTLNSLIGINPKLLNPTTAQGADNTLLTADDGLSLCTCSPAINMGNNALNTEAIDVINNNRVFGGTIDVGAYELQQTNTTNKTYFVKANAPTNSNGVSWASAYNNLQSAVLNNCADTIKVAKGTYKAAITSRDSSFNIYNGVTILGGYPDIGNPTDGNRNTITNPTIISGDIGIANDSTDNTKTLLYIHCPDTTVTIDGLIIQKANGESYLTYGPLSGGGGIKTIGNKRVILNNLIIKKNYAYLGGGLYNSNSNLIINKCIFEDNEANTYNGGGGFLNANYSFYSNQSQSLYTPSLVCKNSVFTTNKGGAVSLPGGGNFENTIFYNNQGNNPGAYLPNNSSARFDNCLFAKNNKTWISPGISINVESTYYGTTLSTFVNNTIFYDNTIYGQQPMFVDPDLNWRITSASANSPIPYGYINYTIVSSGNQTTGGSGGNNTVTFRDYNNPLGPDGLWMTSDDGLQVTACSDNIDHGNNFYVQNVPTDILGANRIINTTVDIGPYEANGIPPITPTAIITASDTTICAGTQVYFTPIVTGGTANTSYQWKRNGLNVGTNQPYYSDLNFADGDVVNVVITINNPCVTVQTITSNSITIHVNTSLTGTVSISSSANPSCVGNNITFTSTATNQGSSPTYQWKVNGINAGFNSPTFTTNSLVNNDIVSLQLTSSLTCITNSPIVSNNITQVLNSSSAVPTVTVNTSSTSVCAGASITFNAVATNSGTSPTYQWQVNGVNVGTNSNIFTTNSLTNNAQVKCILTSNAPCITTQTANSNVLNITVNPTLTPSVSISTVSSTICTGSSTTFTANATNGGSTPSYQWQVNGANVGTNSPTFTSSTLSNNDQVICILTSNATCASPQVATSNTIVILVNASVVPSVSITSSVNTICSGSSITFTAAPTNGGSTPSYQWQVNGVNAGTNSNTFTSSTLTNSSVVKVIMTSSLACALPQSATSNSINIIVNNTVTPTASFTSSATSICNGASITFTSTSTNVGTAPIYQWKKNGLNVGTNSATYSSNGFVNGDAITLTVTSNAICANNTPVTSNSVVLTVTTANPAITIAGNTTVVLNSSTNITSTALFAGTTPIYQWQDSTNLHTWANISGATNASLLYSPTTLLGNKLRCILTSSSNCSIGVVATSNVLSFNVTPSIVAPNPTGDYTLRYFPNPVHNSLTIDSLQLSKEWESLKILKADGAELKTYLNYLVGKTKITFNVEMLKPGVYFLLLTRKQGVPVYLKFVKL